MLKRPMPGERTGPLESAFNDADFSHSYPTLAAYLSETKYDQGQPRVTSTMLVFLENGVLRVCINDRDNNRSVFFTGETFEAALMAAENALLSGTAEWRSKQGYTRTTERTPF